MNAKGVGISGSRGQTKNQFCVLLVNPNIGVKQGKMLTQKRVKELFDYRDGELIRKVDVRRSKVGDIAGSIDSHGYLHTGIDGKTYLNHRLVWLWHHGFMPENQLDHIDQNPLNNRIDNLREASRSCNMRNRKQQKTTSGVKGVCWNKQGNKWQARITVKRKLIGLGCTDNLLEAACIRLAAEQCLGWARCDTTSPAFLFVKNNIAKETQVYEMKPGWHIEKNMKPIPDRRHDYDFWHDDYDGCDGGNGLAGTASSVEDAERQIEEIEQETR